MRYWAATWASIMSRPCTAQDSGSTSAPQGRGISRGRRNALADGTATNSAQAPFADPTPIAFQFSQRLKWPARHCRHVPSNKDGSTATKSPAFRLPTPAPSATTSPENSCPGTIGYRVGANSPRRTWMSVPQIPQASTLTTTSPSLGEGSSIFLTCRSLGASMTTAFTCPLFDSAHSQAADELLLGDPARKQYREAGQGGGGCELGVEESAAADEADQEQGRGGRVRRCEVDGVEELVPAEDQTDQRGRRNPGGDQRHHDAEDLVAELRPVDAGRLEQVGRDLEEERPQQPHAERQVDRRVDQREGEDVVEQVEVARQQVQRHQARREGQEPGRDEEEEHVARPLHGADRQGVGRRQSEHKDQERREDAGDRGVDEVRRKVAGQHGLKLLERRGKGRDDHRDDADGRRLADAEALEGHEVEQEGDVRGVLARTSEGEHEDRVKRLHHEERSQQRAQLDEGPDQRQCDP